MDPRDLHKFTSTLDLAGYGAEAWVWPSLLPNDGEPVDAKYQWRWVHPGTTIKPGDMAWYKPRGAVTHSWCHFKEEIYTRTHKVVEAMPTRRMIRWECLHKFEPLRLTAEDIFDKPPPKHHCPVCAALRYQFVTQLA